MQCTCASIFLLDSTLTITGNDLNSKAKQQSGYPKVITQLPEAEVDLQGGRAWIMQGENRQIVFCEYEAGVSLPEHSHAYAQWGMVIDGEMELIVDGKSRICQKGDEYLIAAKTKHFVKFQCKTRIIDLFSESGRYKPK
jgi:quercetin dioxygenase-like cupin family protein